MTRFSHDGSSQFFCMSKDRRLSFYDAQTLDLLSFTMISSNDVVDISSIGNSNIVAIVPKTPNQVEVWDRIQKAFYYALNPSDTIVGVRMRPDILVAICRSQIFIFNLFDMNQLCAIQTAENTNAVFDMEYSYESATLAVPSPQIGVLAVYNWVTSETCSEVAIFKSKPIKFVRFCKSGRLIAVASDMSEKVKVVTVRSSKLVAVLKLSKKEKVADIRFDEWAMQVMVVTEGHVLKLYELPAMEASAEVRMSVKPVATFTLGRTQFWAFFGEKLFEINVVSADFMFYRLKYDNTTRSIKRDNGVRLQTGKEMKGSKKGM